MYICYDSIGNETTFHQTHEEARNHALDVAERFALQQRAERPDWYAHVEEIVEQMYIAHVTHHIETRPGLACYSTRNGLEEELFPDFVCVSGSPECYRYWEE